MTPSLLEYFDSAWLMTVLPQPKAPGMEQVPAGSTHNARNTANATAHNAHVHSPTWSSPSLGEVTHDPPDPLHTHA